MRSKTDFLSVDESRKGLFFQLVECEMCKILNGDKPSMTNECQTVSVALNATVA